MGKILIAAYLIGAVITAFVMILLISAVAASEKLNDAKMEDASGDAPMGKGMGFLLAAVLVVVTAVGWLPLLILMLRTAWREMEEDA